MFPLRDDVPSRRVPIVTWTIVALNVAVFFWQLTLPKQAIEQLFYVYGIVPARFSHPAWAARVGFPPGGALSFFTSMFLHGGLLHVASNMWTLWIFGDNVEDRMGRLRYVLFYLLCGLAAGLLHWLTNTSSTAPTIGASGAIAGVLGAYLRWYPGAKVLTLIPIFFYPLFVELPALVFLGFWFVSQLFSGVVALGMPTNVGGVAWWAHVGGFLAGMGLCGWFARSDFQVPPPRVRHHLFPNAHPRGRTPSDWI